jgi:hypothetical protein
MSIVDTRFTLLEIAGNLLKNKKATERIRTAALIIPSELRKSRLTQIIHKFEQQSRPISRKH